MEMKKMKKFFALILALMTCISLASPAFADTFTPSVSYKDGPTIVSALLDGKDVDDCVVITTIQEAKKKTTDITQDERDLLLEVYEKLTNGSMKVTGLPEGFVIRELVDVSFEHDDCRILDDHNHKDVQLKKIGSKLEVVFDLDIAKGVEVVVMTYIDGQWAPIESVKNNGDGTITCIFEDICPVLFAVKQAAHGSQGAQGSFNPKTGDMIGQSMMMWMGLMAFAAVALVGVVAVSRKRK